MVETTHYIEDKNRQKILLVAILLTNIIAMLNTTTVTLSLPSYMSIFQIDINTVQWVVIGYLLPLGMVMPLSGYLCERYSYRKVFLFGIIALGVCSLGCACSLNFYMLVVFRFLKGIAGGLTVPCTMSMLYRYIPKRLQATYLGNTVLFQSVGVAIGPTLAGFILQVSSWHVLFLFNIPLVLIALWAANRSVPIEAVDFAGKFDYIGIFQVSIGTGMVMIAFSEGEQWGWTSAAFFLCLGVGLALVAVFVVRQFHTTHPLLNFAVLKYRPFVLAVLIQCTLAMTLGITGILVQLYFQTVRGFSPAATGLFLLGPSVVLMLGNNAANLLHKRGKARWLIVGGLLFAVLGNLGLCKLYVETNWLIIMFYFCLRYFGMGIVQMPLTNYGLSVVPADLSGHASSMYNWAKQLAQVVSTNILTVLLSLNLTRYYLANGNTGVPTEGTDAYNIAASQAVSSDFFYLTIFLVISLCCTFFIRSENQKKAA